MSDGINRIFNILESSNKEQLASNFVTLKVKTTSPLTFILDDKVTLTSDFYTVSDTLDKSKFSIGDAVLATVYNNGQTYFIQEAVNTANSVNVNARTNDLPNLIYPIGSVYATINNSNPSSKLGGSWQSIGNNTVGSTTVYYWKRNS